VNKKVLASAFLLVSILTIGLVYAVENGFFIKITNSNGNINTAISNSTVIENVTLTNGTLNLQINADSISSVIINGVNYSAQPPRNPEPEVLLAYYGENAVPDGIVGFPNPWFDLFSNQSAPSFYYSWNLTMVNLNPVNGIGVPMERAFQPLVTKYPMLATSHMFVPNAPYGSGNLTLYCDVAGFNGRMDKLCMVLFSYSQLDIDQIGNLTQDMVMQLTPAIIEWYS
jgi:hypothetical protein